jgi:iron-sulfur cluster insertion protein
MITITEKAAGEVRKIVESDPTLVGQSLRVSVKGGGCAGFSHDLFFEDKTGELDEVFESHGITFCVDPLSAQYLEETEIDYVEEAHAAGFKFKNPNVKGTCGCGSSVSF